MDAATLHHRPFVNWVLAAAPAALPWAPNPAAAQLRPGDILYIDRIPGPFGSGQHLVGVRPDGSPSGIDVRGGAPVDLLTGPSGIYVANAGQISQVDPATGGQTPIFTTQDLRWAFLSLEPGGTFLAATVDRGLARADPATGAVTTLSSGGGDEWLHARVGPDGSIYLFSPTGLEEFDPATGGRRLIRPYADIGVDPTAGVPPPTYGFRFAVAPDGDVIFGQTLPLGPPPGGDTGVVVRIDPETGEQDVIYRSGRDLVFNPWDVAIAADGDVLVANVGANVGGDVFDGSIDRIDSVTGQRTVVVSGLMDPVHVAVVVPEPATAFLCAAPAAVTLAHRRNRLSRVAP